MPRLEIDNKDSTLAKIVKQDIIYRLYRNNDISISCIAFLKSENFKDFKIYRKSFLK